MSLRGNTHLFWAALFILAGALSIHAQKVRVGADPAVDVSKYKTYAWSSGTTGTNAIINQQIVAAVDAQLAAKGLKKVETDPELTISALVWTESDMHISNPSWHPSLNSLSTGVYAGASGWPVTKGTLVVNISDTKTKNEVWRGTATDTLKQGPSGNKVEDAKTAEKPIRKAVQKMFKQFPNPSRK